MDFKPLIVVTQPRIIPQFIDQFYKQHRGSKYDRLVIQFAPLTKAYNIARVQFLQHTRYTHYIYATDDILWTDEGLERLISDYRKHFEGHRDCILAADMNTDQESINHLRAFLTYRHPVPKLEYGRKYVKEDFPWAALDDEEILYSKEHTDGIIRCSFSALQLAIIPRHIIDNTSFMTDIEYNNMQNPDKIQIDPKWGCCIDAIFAKECHDNGFLIYTDLNVPCIHLKQSNNKNQWLEEYFRVGKDPEQYFFLKARTNERITVWT